MKTLKPIIKLTSYAILSAYLASCSDNNASHEAERPSQSTQMSERWIPVEQALKCFITKGPIISAHRGRDKYLGFADNSMEGLISLRNKGFIMAEIDVSHLKDGTMILYHDGVWDSSSTGRGVVAATPWSQASKYLLKTKKGRITASRISTFDSILNWADQRFYFEIDIKSSANESEIIWAIKKAEMDNHVILISYTDKQASRLKRLSEKIVGHPIPIAQTVRKHKSVSKLDDKTTLAWLGTSPFDVDLLKKLKAENIPSAYGMMSPKYNKAKNLDLLTVIVSDYPKEAKSLTKIKAADKSRLQNCNPN